MSKKLIAFGAALLASTASVQMNARVTGFYVGIQGGVDVAQFKIFDGSSHQGCTSSVSYAAGSRISAPSGIPGADASAEIYSNGAPVSIPTPSVLTGRDDFEATPEYLYRVRPAGEIFVGYNYQVGSNFVVGAEIRGGLTFGSHKFDGSVRVPDLTCYELTGEDSTTYGPTADDFYQNQYRKTKFELDTKFTGDFSLRLGCVLPGTDGRFAVFLRGGVGLVRQELTFSQDSGALYREAAVNAAYKGVSAEMRKYRVELKKGGHTLGDGTNTFGDEAANGYLVCARVREFPNLNYPYTGDVQGGLSLPAPLYGNSIGTSAGALAADVQTWIGGGNPADTQQAFYAVAAAATYLLDASITETYGLTDISKRKTVLSEQQETKNRFTWHAGLDGEYHFANGLFVRASYTFKYIKGFFVEKQTKIDSLTSQEIKQSLSSAVDGGTFDKWFKGSVSVATAADNTALMYPFADGGALALGNAGSAVRTAIAQLMEDQLSDPQGSLELGTINTKVGTNEKSFSHQFTLGVGFKFCM